jgi:hypothetical protein
MAFKTELNGRTLDFRPLTAFNNNIIYHDAGSGNYIQQQLDGRVIAGPDTVAVFSRCLDGQVLTFRLETTNGNEKVIAVDDKNNSQWDITGVEYSRDTQASGRKLKPIPHFGKLFWFSWSLFKSQTDIKEAI